jgi:hypothetical protein
MRKAPEVKLSNEEREELKMWIRARTLPTWQGMQGEKRGLAGVWPSFVIFLSNASIYRAEIVPSGRFFRDHLI